MAAGPVVGGAVVDGLDWHWMFWVNVPIGLLLVPLALRHLTESFGPPARLDVTGVALAGAGLLGVTWALVRGHEAGWGSAEVLGTAALGAALLAAFLRWERRTPQPMLPLGLFRARGFSAANGVSFFMYAGLFGGLFLMSQLLGLALQAVGYAWVASVASAPAGYLELGAAFTVAGVGTSFCFPTVANAVMASVPAEAAGVASGANSALRELGGVFGVAVLAAVFAGGGGYATPAAFLDGFTDAIWVAVALSALGMVAALLSGGRERGAPVPAPVPAA